MHKLLCVCLVTLWACTEDNDSATVDGAVSVDGGTADVGGEGGAGGEGGGGEPDMGAGGAGGDGGAGGGEPSMACTTSCARMTECAAEVCADTDAGQIDAWCLDACAGNASFSAVADGIATCADLVAFGRQTLDPAFGESCNVDPANPPSVPECDPFGERIATCMVEQCAAMAPGQDILERAYVHVCNEQVAMGALNPQQLTQIANENTLCEAMVLANIVSEQVTALGDNCEDGPTPDLETCASACERVAECLPPDDMNAALRNADRCAQLCIGTTNPPDAVWTCAADLGPGECAAVFQCFGQGDPDPGPVEDVPECEGYGARLSACMTEDCEQLGNVGGVDGTLETICDQQVAAGNLTVEAVGAVGEDTDCADASLAPFIAFFLEDTPDNAQDGALAPICEDGPRNPAELCQMACEVAGPCIPEDSEGAALRDLDACRYFCGTADGITPAQWQCMSDIEGCQALGACFQ